MRFIYGARRVEGVEGRKLSRQAGQNLLMHGIMGQVLRVLPNLRP